MALKVVPAGDERCDIHNGRTPASYICKDCVRELGVETGPAPAARGKPIRRLRSKLRRAGRRSRRRLRSPGWREVLLGAVAIIVIAATILLITALTGGGGGGHRTGLPTQEEVVNALGLSPDPSGVGWITLDGACAVLSIQIGSQAAAPTTTTTATPAGEASNTGGTVRALVQNAFSQSQTACVDRVSAALNAHF